MLLPFRPLPLSSIRWQHVLPVGITRNTTIRKTNVTQQTSGSWCLTSIKSEPTGVIWWPRSATPDPVMPTWFHVASLQNWFRSSNAPSPLSTLCHKVTSQPGRSAVYGGRKYRRPNAYTFLTCGTAWRWVAERLSGPHSRFGQDSGPHSRFGQDSQWAAQ